jgi:flagellar export protein FliJ
MAKKFNFRLDSILRLRNHKVSLAKDELSRAAGLRSQKESQIEDKENYYRKMQQSQKGLISACELQAQFHHKTFVEEEIKKLQVERIRLKEIENLKMKTLSTAMQEEKVLEKLKDKKLIEHKSQMNKEETTTLDDVARHQLKNSDNIM